MSEEVGPLFELLLVGMQTRGEIALLDDPLILFTYMELLLADQA